MQMLGDFYTKYTHLYISDPHKLVLHLYGYPSSIRTLPASKRRSNALLDV